MKNINNLVISLACISLAGCAASVPAIQTTETPARAMPTLVLEEPTPEIEYGSFTEDQLYEAIVSELSAQRGQVAEAGDSYFDLAMSTRDITIIQRAIQFASVNSDINALLQLGMLWAQLEPTNPQPQLLLSIQFLESGRLRASYLPYVEGAGTGWRYGFRSPILSYRPPQSPA